MIFKFSAANITSTLTPELLVTSDVLNSTASLCRSQISLVAPFKFDIKEEKKGCARLRISTSVERLIHIHSANLQSFVAAP